MNFQVIGLNHKSAPIEIRERISFSCHNLDSALSLLKQCDAIEENLILSTCNRVEIYARVFGAREGFESIEKFISDFHRVEPEYFKKHLYSFCDIDAAKHLFRVVSSLDSMVVGETQIFGQVRDAYLKAKEAKCAGNILGKIFAEAIRVGKKVRAETQIGKGAVSISRAAIELAQKTLKSFKDRIVLIIGAGKIAELALTNLHRKGAKTILVANRTFERAEELARSFRGVAIKFERIFEHIRDTDIIISSTGAPHYILNKERIQEIMRQRNNRPLFLIDLGLPRNISPDAAGIRNVHLYNIDDLTCVCDANLKERLSEAQKAERIITLCADRLKEELLSFKEEALVSV